MILEFRSAIDLINAINYYQSCGYRTERLWYEYGWFWTVRYYVRMTRVSPKPYIDFIIGPITTRNLPQQPALPHVEFVIGPIATRSNLQKPESPKSPTKLRK